MTRSDCNIIFMGTPGFAVPALKKLVEQKFQVKAVVTAPDKPAGRGLAVHASEVKKASEELGLPVLQPLKLKDETFLKQLKSYNPHLIVVVAFRMLPEEVWKLPVLGTINLHASLLPDYRGAAPINWAIINGEKKTGVTTFFIEKEIDTGAIIDFTETFIDEKDTAETLHNRLMNIGADLLLQTVEKIIQGTCIAKKQDEFIKQPDLLHIAPKIKKEDCRINWNQPVINVYNFIRGLSPYPAAFSELVTPEGDILYMKIFSASKIFTIHTYKPGAILTDGKSFIHVAVQDGFLSIDCLQLAGKKQLKTDEFLRGFKLTESFHFN